jgi:hypothetical protein
MDLQSLLALDTKLPGGHCLTHIGREGRLYDLAPDAWPFWIGTLARHPKVNNPRAQQGIERITEDGLLHAHLVIGGIGYARMVEIKRFWLGRFVSSLSSCSRRRAAVTPHGTPSAH